MEITNRAWAEEVYKLFQQCEVESTGPLARKRMPQCRGECLFEVGCSGPGVGMKLVFGCSVAVVPSPCAGKP